MQDYRYRIRVYTKAGDGYVSVTLTITSTKLLSSNFKDLYKVLSRTLYTTGFVIYEITPNWSILCRQESLRASRTSDGVSLLAIPLD